MTDRLIKIDTLPGMGRSIIQHDDKSKAFRAVRGLVAIQPIRDRVWRRGGPYDQGQTSTCVAQTGKGMLNTSPASSLVPYSTRSKYSIFDFYDGARENDEWEPNDSYDGTSGLGLCKYLTQRGIISEYRWCFGLQDVLLTLSHIGPVGLGIWWYTGMFYPDADGFITPTGQQEGGHEVELHGISASGKYVIGTNSWGRDWGQNGRFKLRFGELERLLNEQGDAFVIVR